jgi:hypothetical protein
MCDYSLMGIPNRLAKEGDDLLAHRFPTGSVGFASARDLRLADPPQTRREGFGSVLMSFFNPPGIALVPAVCVPPGARLILQDIPTHLQRDFEIGPEEEVVFTQLTASEYTYRDAIRFKNGQEVLVQKLREGQRVKVLDLSSIETLEPVGEERPDWLFRRR